MTYNLSDKLIAYLALLSGLSISAVAIYYSVAGLMAIFAAAMIPIMIMGVVLEIGKLSATVWLKQNWQRAPLFLKTYLLVAITVLMLLTSMGIFGYLSKAHLDQAVPTGDIADKVTLLDEKITTQRDNVEAAKKAIQQMDNQVNERLSRSEDDRGAERAVQIRRNQAKERTLLQADIAKAQAEIARLNEERAPIAKELRKVEAEVGPIKYIAALIYGDNPDANLLEAAVRWVIIVIVLVFDPLAVILLLASQYSFAWFRSQQETIVDVPETVKIEPEPEVEEKQENSWPQTSELWPFPAFTAPAQAPNIFDNLDDATRVETVDETELEKSKLDEWNSMIAEAEKAVEQERELNDTEIINSAPETEKQAMAAWKHDNPDSSLKFQRQLLDRGIIDHLPWQDYLKPKADFMDDAAIEAKKWADENPDTEESEKAKEWAKEQGVDADLSWMEKDTQGNQIKKVKEVYQQNAEQNEKTLWQRIQGVKSDK
jgi:uncharacterized membrane protein